jgi:hypothetical protein
MIRRLLLVPAMLFFSVFCGWITYDCCTMAFDNQFHPESDRTIAQPVDESQPVESVAPLSSMAAITQHDN